jgi:hypothetical protein
MTTTADPVPTPAATDARSSGAAAAAASSPTDRTWIRRIDGGGVITEKCPWWCVEPHFDDQDTDLRDLTHSSAEVELPITLHGARVSPPVLSAAIWQHPYEDDAAEREPRAPYIALGPSDADIVEMDCDGLAELIAQLRKHVDRLETLHARLRALQERAGGASSAA